MRIKHVVATLAAVAAVGAFAPSASAVDGCEPTRPTACCGYTLVVEGKSTRLEPNQC